MRPTWDEYFMEMAHLAATRGNCLRRKVGAVIVKERHVLATGYNGPPRGVAPCTECLRTKMDVPSGMRQEICKASHAEQSAIVQAARIGVAVCGSTLFATEQPCAICARMVINAGIVEVRYSHPYEDALAMGLFKEAGILVTHQKHEEDSCFSRGMGHGS